jgi:hypothetical protein
MTRRIVLLCALLTLAPSAAFAQFGIERDVYERPPSMRSPHDGECRRLTRVMAVYADKADLARQRGDELWEESSIQQITRLAERRARLCPAIYAEKPIGQELAKMLRDAAKIAFKLFTMGMI